MMEPTRPRPEQPDLRNVDPATIGLPVAPRVYPAGSTVRHCFRQCDACANELRCTITVFISVNSILCLIDVTGTVIALVLSYVMNLLRYNLLISAHIRSTTPPSSILISGGERQLGMAVWAVHELALQTVPF